MFLNEFRARFLGAMVDEYVQIYMSELTPDELAGLRAFVETPAGQGYAAKQANLVRRGSQVGARVGRDIGVLAAKVRQAPSNGRTQPDCQSDRSRDPAADLPESVGRSPRSKLKRLQRGVR
jgi:hypothetical protein